MNRSLSTLNIKAGLPYGLGFLVFFFLVCFLINVAIGSVDIPFLAIVSSLFRDASQGIYEQIIWDFRLPKAFTCVLAGAGLGTGGLMMQTFFRNPLAGPDVLGLSSGASLMVAFAVLAQGILPFGLGSFQPWGVCSCCNKWSNSYFSNCRCRFRKVKENSSLLIIGMMVAAFTSSLVSVLQFLSKADDLQAFLIWSLGKRWQHQLERTQRNGCDHWNRIANRIRMCKASERLVYGRKLCY